MQVHPRFDNLRRIETAYVADPVVVMEEFRKQHFDMTTVDFQTWDDELRTDSTVSDIATFSEYDHTGVGYAFIAWSGRRPPFDDERVRRAMTHLVNRQWIVLLHGQARVARIAQPLRKIVSVPGADRFCAGHLENARAGDDMRMLFLVAALAACKKEKVDDTIDDTGIYNPGGDDTGGGDDTSTTCESTQGAVTGVVRGPYTTDPNPNGTVFASDGMGGNGHAKTDADGTYGLPLEAGDWLLSAEGSGCYSATVSVTVEPCDELTVDFQLENCDVADKPNLYLYPRRDTPTRVNLEIGPRQKVVASDPPYADGWRGIAHPDGTFTAQGQRAPFLFYEVSLASWQSRSLQREEGWCVDGPPEAAAVAMAEILGDYGFDAVEQDDFVEAWRIDLPPATTYAVYPQGEVDDLAGLDIRPALPVERLWLVVDDAPACDIAAAPVVVPFDRRGPHGVEWGVVLGDVVR